MQREGYCRVLEGRNGISAISAREKILQITTLCVPGPDIHWLVDNEPPIRCALDSASLGCMEGSI